MTDADTNVVTVTRCSTFDRPPIDIGGPYPGDLDRLAASLDYLEALGRKCLTQSFMLLPTLE